MKKFFILKIFIVQQQAEHFCNAIGVLQQCQVDEDFSQLFAQLIFRCAKDIDTLVDSLPCEESSPELQNQSLKVLETENQQSAEKLDEVMESAMKLLKKIQDALEDIAQAQLNMQITFKNSK